MSAERRHSVREKQFPRFSPDGDIFRLPGVATLTDDHSLFLLNQDREQRSKVERRSWLSRLFRRR